MPIFYLTIWYKGNQNKAYVQLYKIYVAYPL